MKILSRWLELRFESLESNAVASNLKWMCIWTQQSTKSKTMVRKNCTYRVGRSEISASVQTEIESALVQFQFRRRSKKPDGQPTQRETSLHRVWIVRALRLRGRWWLAWRPVRRRNPFLAPRKIEGDRIVQHDWTSLILAFVTPSGSLEQTGTEKLWLYCHGREVLHSGAKKGLIGLTIEEGSNSLGEKRFRQKEEISRKSEL